MVARRQKGSKNKQKAITKLSKIHKRVADIRNDTVHKLTSSLVKTKPKIIVIETLKPKNMSKNHKLASAVLDSSFGKIKDTLKYKCSWNEIHLIMAPTYYASSKYCSIYGHKHNELKLSDREWTCKNCGTHLDRDVNAAKNLQFFGLWMIDKHSPSGESTVSSTESNACGDERLQFLTEQCSSMKQEFKSQNHALHSFAQICQNGWYQTVQKVGKEYQKQTNRKKDLANKIVHKFSQYETIVIQDEQLSNWQKSRGSESQLSSVKPEDSNLQIGISSHM